MLAKQMRAFSIGYTNGRKGVAFVNVLKTAVARNAFSTTSINQAGSSKDVQSRKKAIEAEKKKLKSLKSKLSKEKSVLSKLQKKFREETKRLKDKEKKKAASISAKEKNARAKVSEKKTLVEATKPFRKLSAFNFYIKENVSKDKSLKDVTSEWKTLSEYEKMDYQEKVDDFNEKQLQIYKPKPKAPANSFASFVKQNHSNDGRTFKEISQDLAEKWKALSADEKASYSASAKDKEEYKKNLEEWTQERLRIYKESKSHA